MKRQRIIIPQLVLFLMVLLMAIALEAVGRDNDSSGVSKVKADFENDMPIYWSPEQFMICTEYQSDGTSIEIEFVLGGENMRYGWHRKNGYTIGYDHETGYWCWMRQGADGDVELTEYPVHLFDPNELGLEKNIRMTKEKAEEWIRASKETNRKHMGHQDNLMIHNDYTWVY